MKKAIVNSDNSFGGIFTEYYINSNNKINGVLVSELTFTNELPNGLKKPFFNGTEWIESATSEEITEIERLKIPGTITRMNLKIQLLLKGISIDYIIQVIDSLDSSVFSDIDKQIAIIKLNEAQYFERENQDFKMISQICGLSDLDLDEIFTKGNEHLI